MVSNEQNGKPLVNGEKSVTDRYKFGCGSEGRSLGGIDRRKNYDSRSWDSARFIVPLLRDAIEDAIIDCTEESAPGVKCLDIGCGLQPFRRKIVGLGYEYRGMDVEQNSIGSVDFLGHVDGLLPPELLSWLPVDFALITEVMEHVADWDSAFYNLFRILKPGGRALLTCPFVYPLHEEPFDFWRPTKHALRFFAERHGLMVIEQRNIGGFWDVVGTVVGSLDVGRLVDWRSGAWANLEVFRKKIFRRLLLAAISSRLLRWVAPCNAAIYLSNVVILERSKGGEERSDSHVGCR